MTLGRGLRQTVKLPWAWVAVTTEELSSAKPLSRALKCSLWKKPRGRAIRPLFTHVSDLIWLGPSTVSTLSWPSALTLTITSTHVLSLSQGENRWKKKKKNTEFTLPLEQWSLKYYKIQTYSSISVGPRMFNPVLEFSTLFGPHCDTYAYILLRKRNCIRITLIHGWLPLLIYH